MESRLRGLDEHLAPNGERIETRIDGRPDAMVDYVIFRREYQGMPPRQPGAQDQPDSNRTTIVLAFPHRNHKPLAEGQKTYAYLPVNSFGFRVGPLPPLRVDLTPNSGAVYHSC